MRDGDDWVLNGTKAWVSSGTRGDVVLAMARTDAPGDRRGARGIGAFIVTPDMPGFSVGKKEDKMGLRASPTVQLVFQDLRVPAANLLGARRAGASSTPCSRWTTGGWASRPRPWASPARRWSTRRRYAAERRQFGKPIKEFQAIQFKLADMATRVSASRALLHAAAAAKDRGRPRDTGQFDGQVDGQ